MDYESVIHAIIDPIVNDPSSVLIRINEGASAKDLTILIVSEQSDTARLIGKKGAVANDLREILSLAGKVDKKRVHLKFESFESENKEDK